MAAPPVLDIITEQLLTIPLVTPLVTLTHTKTVALLKFFLWRGFRKYLNKPKNNVY